MNRKFAMALILPPSTKENAPQRAEVQLESYTHDPLVYSIMPNASKEVRVKFFAEVLTKDMDKPGVKNLEIIDSKTGWAVKSRIPIQGFKFLMMTNTDVN
jgi:hypothetical protein